MAAETCLIVGAGQAGGRAAEALRKGRFAGRVLLMGEEPESPYERPPLSKAVLVGAKPPASSYLLPPAFYAENRIELRTGARVVGIDAAGHRVELSTGEKLAYDKLLLATGGRVRTLPFAPLGRPGVFYLRTIADCMALVAALKVARRLVVVGGGFLGLEVAASARKLGLAVTVLECMPSILDRAMAPGIARFVHELHLRHGTDIRTNVKVTGIVGEGRLEAIACGDGSSYPADLVLIAVGIIPNTELAAAAGARIENGIVVDEFGRTTVDGIYAAGDVTYHPNPILGHRLRLESWQNAQNQAIAVARGLSGAPQPYAEVPWFWTDQYDANIQMVGAPLRTDEVVVRGDPASGRFMAFNLADGRVVGATAFNMGGEIRFARKLIETRASPDSASLGDPERKLKDIVAALAA